MTTKTEVKPSPKAKKSSKRNTHAKQGNTRKAAAAPKMMSVAQGAKVAIEDFPDAIKRIDTSSVEVVVREHTPKQGRHEGELTHKLKLALPGDKSVYIYQDLATALADAAQEDLAGLVFQLVEYRRGLNAQ